MYNTIEQHHLFLEIAHVHKEHNTLLQTMKWSRGTKRTAYENTIKDLEKISESKTRELNRIVNIERDERSTGAFLPIMGQDPEIYRLRNSRVEAQKQQQ